MSIRVLMLQMIVSVNWTLEKGWIEYDEVAAELEDCFALIEREKPDLVVFPETCYFPQVHDTYVKLAENRYILAGSAYMKEGTIDTHLFGPKGYHLAVPKMFPSPKETMEFNHPNYDAPDLVVKAWEEQVQKGEWPEYFPLLDIDGGKRVAVLNCMDYYRLGYFVACSSVLSPHLWGILSPCSNGNQEIFKRLSGAIHDANDKIYSIVVNSHNRNRAKGATQGESYIMGPITHNVKALLRLNGNESDHFAFIAEMGSEPSALMMDLQDGAEVRFFARSKDFRSNPSRMKRFELREK